MRDEREAITPALSRFTGLKLLQAAGVSGYEQLALGVNGEKSLLIYASRACNSPPIFHRTL